MIFWDEKTCAKAQKMWLDGASGATIARAIHTSRSAVIAKAHREGWVRPAAPSAPRGTKPAARRVRAVRKPPVLRLVSAPAPKPRETPASAVESLAPRPWLTRETGECAFIVEGEGADAIACCNGAERGQNYCEGHRGTLRSRVRQETWSRSSLPKWALA